jgi:hypothetical protein
MTTEIELFEELEMAHVTKDLRCILLGVTWLLTAQVDRKHLLHHHRGETDLHSKRGSKPVFEMADRRDVLQVNSVETEVIDGVAQPVLSGTLELDGNHVDGELRLLVPSGG